MDICLALMQEACDGPAEWLQGLDDLTSWVEAWASNFPSIKTKFSRRTGGFEGMLAKGQEVLGTVTKKDMQDLLRFARLLVDGFMEGAGEGDEEDDEASSKLKLRRAMASYVGFLQLAKAEEATGEPPHTSNPPNSNPPAIPRCPSLN
jgi:hypothetical protein